MIKKMKFRIDEIKKETRFKVVEFLYKHKLFGFHKKCWADLVIYSMISGDWDSVRTAKKCGYCGACMTREEIISMKGGAVNE